MDMYSTEFSAAKARTPSQLLLLLDRLRRAWAIRRTRASVANLTPEQLRDIGLDPGRSPLEAIDGHHRYWRRHLT